jgi:hypothetical protein
MRAAQDEQVDWFAQPPAVASSVHHVYLYVHPVYFLRVSLQ